MSIFDDTGFLSLACHSPAKGDLPPQLRPRPNFGRFERISRGGAINCPPSHRKRNSGHGKRQLSEIRAMLASYNECAPLRPKVKRPNRANKRTIYKYKRIMIHFGKEPSGDLNIRISAEDVGEVYEALESTGLLQRRTFDGLKRYIGEQFADELARHRRRMTAQIPLIEGGTKSC